ncbi:MAG: hypothetical protein R3C99_05515 [Pirellulaceae bacterium]
MPTRLNERARGALPTARLSDLPRHWIAEHPKKFDRIPQAADVRTETIVRERPGTLSAFATRRREILTVNTVLTAVRLCFAPEPSACAGCATVA